MGKTKEYEGITKGGLILTAMLCSTLLGLVSLIGGFWGKEGFRTVGIGLGIIVIVMLAIAIVIADGN